MVDFDELMQKHAAATPGPWEVKSGEFEGDDGYGSITLPYVEANGKTICIPTDRGPDDDNDEDDAAYIVAACNAVPELVARIRELESEIKRRDAQRWADLCNDCESDGSCPYLGTCPFDEKKCGDVRPADWLKWMEEKK